LDVQYALSTVAKARFGLMAGGRETYMRIEHDLLGEKEIPDDAYYWCARKSCFQRSRSAPCLI